MPQRIQKLFCKVKTGKFGRGEKREKPNANISIRTTPVGRRYEWHPTKGFRGWIDSTTRDA
jgi:hypothetical protein